ncbi:hypothetical protein [Microbulbifer sp. TRSA005]|uniref:hypothetical protein n=1 Tax=Microbulbifer sp. TRSA005 TaxID=3243383 RepID=UPI004039F471
MSLLTKICLLLLMLFAASTYAESSRASLEALFAETYDPNRKVDSDWVLSRERNLAAWKRMNAVHQAIYYGEDLSFLSKYGFEKKKPSWYEIHYADHPEWLTAYDLLGALSSLHMLQNNQAELYQLGMSVAEVQKLSRYVLANDLFEIETKELLDCLQEEGDAYVGRFLQGGEDFANIYIELIHKFNLRRHLVNIDWVIKLFSLFDSEAQSILLTYGVSNIASMSGMGNYNLDREVKLFMGYFLSGQLTASLRSSLEEHREKRQAEIAQRNTVFNPRIDRAMNKYSCSPKQCSYQNP